jgi:hypothetical protein
VGAPETPPAAVDELWQPLIYNERRFPHESFLEAAYRCPLPTTLVTRSGVTTGVLADPAEYPFQPLPNFANSRFGVALRNQRGAAQPMLFAPLLGGAGSRMKAGETREFVMRLVVAKANLSATYERVARTLYGFADVRHNALGSLNATFERMLEFGLSDYAKFNADLRGFAYDTDVPGAVKNVSALHPLGLALVTDRPEIYTRLARPLMEFFVSRERFLFTTDPKVKGQSASSRLGGLGAPLTEYANLYAMSGKRTPFFRTAAEGLFGRDRILNLEGNIRGDNWSNALGLYRATGEKRWLDHAIKDADAYLKTRVGVRPAGLFGSRFARVVFLDGVHAAVDRVVRTLRGNQAATLSRRGPRRRTGLRAIRLARAAHPGRRGARATRMAWRPPIGPDPRFPRIKAEPETVPRGAPPRSASPASRLRRAKVRAAFSSRATHHGCCASHRSRTTRFSTTSPAPRSSAATPVFPATISTPRARPPTKNRTSRGAERTNSTRRPRFTTITSGRTSRCCSTTSWRTPLRSRAGPSIFRRATPRATATCSNACSAIAPARSTTRAAFICGCRAAC